MEKIIRFQKQPPAWTVIIDSDKEPACEVTQATGREVIFICAKTWDQAEQLRKQIENRNRRGRDGKRV